MNEKSSKENDKPSKKKEKKPRVPMPEQPPEVRSHNFDEVPLGYSPEQAQAEAERCLQCKKPFCLEGCPVNIDIPAFIDLIVEGKFAESARKIKETNCLPAICGRVCPQETQCEVLCVLGKKWEPVAIGRLERFVADYERDQGLIELPEKAPDTGKRVAVVGSCNALVILLYTLYKKLILFVNTLLIVYVKSILLVSVVIILYDLLNDLVIAVLILYTISNDLVIPSRTKYCLESNLLIVLRIYV